MPEEQAQQVPHRHACCSVCSIKPLQLEAPNLAVVHPQPDIRLKLMLHEFQRLSPNLALIAQDYLKVRFSILRFCSASGRISASSSLRRAWISSSVSGTACESIYSPVTEAAYQVTPHVYLLAAFGAAHSSRFLLLACIEYFASQQRKSCWAALKMTHF